jgi:hypothetical protein
VHSGSPTKKPTIDKDLPGKWMKTTKCITMKAAPAEYGQKIVGIKSDESDML